MEREKEDVFDNCVVCGKQTKEEVNKHIDYRDYYVEGSGQLCKGCWVEIYFD